MKEEIRVRREIMDRCRAEMLGPGSEDISNGNIERETISDSPKERYSVGILFPQQTLTELNDGEVKVKVEEGVESEDDKEITYDKYNNGIECSNQKLSFSEEGAQEQITMTNQFLPSAMGFTFFAKAQLESLNVKISCATYRESTFKDCSVLAQNFKDDDIKKYFLNEYIYLENDLLKLKKNITKKIIHGMVNGREIESERPDIVARLYKLADICTVEKFNTGYVRVPVLKEKNIEIKLSNENNKIFITETGEVSESQGILKLNVLKKAYGEEVYSYTVVLVNENKESNSYKKCIFQPEIRINTYDNNIQFIEHTYMSKKGIGIINDEDLVYELLYRNKKSYAIGHGVGTGQLVDDITGKGEIYTDYMPSFEVPQLEFTIEKLERSEDILSMYELSDLSSITRKQKIELLNDFAKAYESWIKELINNSKNIDNIFTKVVQEQIQKCENTLERIRRGITILGTDSVAYSSFSLMNRAMLMQRYHSKFTGGEHDRYPEDKEFPEFNYLNIEKKQASWRAFQLAFILMNIEGINDSNSKDRDIVDLIWIPTGGGKTEAYLGLTGFTIFLRRLKDPKNGGGTAIIMRYTLRLLAAQQFVRASILICACEKIRKETKEYDLGKDEISIGLWVGGTPTPNTNLKAKDEFKKMRDECRRATSANELEFIKSNHNKFQVLKCPWCGTRLEIDYVEGKKKGLWGYDYDKKKIIFCPDRRCDFTKKLPIQVVDEELYKNPPTLLFGTVDKFAALPWEGDVSRLFGLGDSNIKQPELIIQDELHLISGPLGSMVGLYETAIDALCTNITSGNSVRPKIVASTATIKRATEQCKMLFNRSVAQFPPSGLDIEDSFFIREIPIDKKHGRMYVGIMPTGKTPTTTQVRLYTALLESSKFIEADEGLLDKYWTVVGYFNSIRELGKTSNLVKDDIASNIVRYMRRLLKADKTRYASIAQELTSRVESTEIVKILKNLENKYTEETDKNFNNRAIDVLLASNMISVGVDVSRLNLMIICGQPKQTSEYIQASSRVGRRDPGLAFTLYNQSKTRDRSHYELFYPYHQTFYKYVEPTSITPFSEQARERGLHAVLISMVRHLLDLRGDQDANYFTDELDKLEDIKKYILDRAKALDNTDLQDIAIETEKELNIIIEKWSNKVKTTVDDDRVCYKSDKFNKNLLVPYLKRNESNAFPTMQSLRNVDNEAKVEIIVFGGEEDE